MGWPSPQKSLSAETSWMIASKISYGGHLVTFSPGKLTGQASCKAGKTAPHSLQWVNFSAELGTLWISGYPEATDNMLYQGTGKEAWDWKISAVALLQPILCCLFSSSSFFCFNYCFIFLLLFTFSVSLFPSSLFLPFPPSLYPYFYLNHWENLGQLLKIWKPEFSHKDKKEYLI